MGIRNMDERYPDIAQIAATLHERVLEGFSRYGMDGTPLVPLFVPIDRLVKLAGLDLPPLQEELDAQRPYHKLKATG